MKTDKNGQEHKTIADAAKELRIGVSTVRRYIRNGTFDKPQRVFFGSVGYAVFSDEYLKKAAAKLDNMRKANGEE